MQKILLVIDVYGELIQLESLLKKLGFDTLGMQNSLSFADQVLGFSPDVIVLSGKGPRVNGLELSQKIKKRKGVPKIVMLFPHGYQPAPSELASASMDAVFEMPIDPMRFLTGLCKLTGLDSSILIEKFAKLQGFAAGEEYGSSIAGSQRQNDALIHVEGGSDGPSRNRHLDRTRKYREFAAEITLPGGTGGLSRDRIQAAVKDIRKNGIPEQDQELDANRREFVKALFDRHR